MRSRICQQKNMQVVICQVMILILILSCVCSVAKASLVDALNDQISQAEQKRRELEQKAAEYQKLINDKQKEIKNLTNQVAIIDAQIGKKELDIEITQKNIGPKQRIVNNIPAFFIFTMNYHVMTSSAAIGPDKNYYWVTSRNFFVYFGPIHALVKSIFHQANISPCLWPNNQIFVKNRLFGQKTGSDRIPMVCKNHRH